MQLIRDFAFIDNLLFYCLPVSALLINSIQAFLESSNSRVRISCYSKYIVTEQQTCREDERTTKGEREREIKKEYVSHLGFFGHELLL